MIWVFLVPGPLDVYATLIMGLELSERGGGGGREERGGLLSCK